MVSDGRAQLVRKRLRRQIGLENRRAVLGDASGVVYDPDLTGNVLVRDVAGVSSTGATEYSAPYSVRMQGVLQLDPGAAVIVGYDEDGELAVLKIDFAGQKQQGRNPLFANPADQNVFGYVNSAKIAALYCHAYGTPSNPSTEVVVRAWVYVEDDVAHLFQGERVDLAAYIPAANLQRLAGLFLLDDDTLEVVASAVQPLAIPLGIEDVQELIDGRTVGAKPVKAWRLADDQAAITDADDYLDLRGILNVSEGGAADASEVGYTPSSTTPWGGSDPGEVDDALNALVQRLYNVEQAAPFSNSNIISGDDQTDGAGLYLIATSAGPITLTLATADASGFGTHILIVDHIGQASSNNVTVDTQGGELINGGGSLTISTDYGVLWLMSISGNWVRLL